MTRHIAIGLAVLGVMLVRLGWQRRRRRYGGLPSGVAARLDIPVRELLSPSGRFKAVAFGHGVGAYRVEVFTLAAGEGEEQFWRRVSGPSFADTASVADVLEGGLRTASGEPWPE